MSKEVPTFAPCGPDGRRPERIDELLSELSIYWHQRPDLRLGQIVDNFAKSLASVLHLRGDNGVAARELEDDALLGMLTSGLPYPPAAANEYFDSSAPAVQ
jgi:uncharacterized protein YihD (DUF1040 family)